MAKLSKLSGLWESGKKEKLIENLLLRDPRAYQQIQAEHSNWKILRSRHMKFNIKGTKKSRLQMNIQLMQVCRFIYIFGKKSDSNLNPYFVCEVVLQMDIQICKYMVLFYFIFYPEKLEFESEYFTLSIRSDCKWISNYYASMQFFFWS